MSRECFAGFVLLAFAIGLVVLRVWEMWPRDGGSCSLGFFKN